MKNIINLTPHDITIVGDENKKSIVIPASGVVARVATNIVKVGEINGIPVTQTSFGNLENLPDECADTVYIVSSIVAQAAKGRADIFIPNESVRDERGRIIGCRSLGRITS